MALLNESKRSLVYEHTFRNYSEAVKSWKISKELNGTKFSILHIDFKHKLEQKLAIRNGTNVFRLQNRSNIFDVAV